jgi:hypothetical protein
MAPFRHATVPLHSSSLAVTDFAVSLALLSAPMPRPVQNYTARMVDSSLPFDQQQEALKFATHFIGDIHQPLHVGFTTDKGGNTYVGTFEGQSGVNLHMVRDDHFTARSCSAMLIVCVVLCCVQVWDVNIIEKRTNDDFNGDPNAYMQYLWQQIQGPWAGQAQQWITCQNPIPSNACSSEVQCVFVHAWQRARPFSPLLASLCFGVCAVGFRVDCRGVSVRVRGGRW